MTMTLKEQNDKAKEILERYGVEFIPAVDNITLMTASQLFRDITNKPKEQALYHTKSTDPQIAITWLFGNGAAIAKFLGVASKYIDELMVDGARPDELASDYYNILEGIEVLWEEQKEIHNELAKAGCLNLNLSLNVHE